MAADPVSIEEWVDYLSQAEIPVLKHTAREMAKLQADPDSVSGRAIFSVVIPDPLMVFRVLRYAHTHKSRSQVHDIVQIEHIVMMMGTETFFRALPPKPLVDDILRTNLPALASLLKLIHRGHRASQYAFNWAAILHDLHSEEVGISALLHDLVEMLMWCHAPEKMLKIQALQQADKTLRSHHVQAEVFGFTFAELQHKLLDQCGMTPLLVRLLRDENATEPRARNVIVAVNLARHSSHGWDDAALPDDYRDVAELLHVDVNRAMHIIGVPGHGIS